MKAILSILLAWAVLPAGAAVNLLLQDTNGLIAEPSGFFQANIVKLTDALNEAGYSGGGGETNLADMVDVSLSSLSDLDLLSYDVVSGKWTNRATTAAGWALIQAATAADQRTALGLGSAALLSSSAFLADGTSNGIVARTGAGTVTTIHIVGDSEAEVTGGDGQSGNIVLSIGAAIARVAALASYQPLALILTQLSALSPATGAVLWYNGSTWTNLPVGSVGNILTVQSGPVLGWASPAGGGDAYLANDQTWAGNNTWLGTNWIHHLVATNFTADTGNFTEVVLGSPLGTGSGGTSATNAVGARVALGVEIDVDVLGYTAIMGSLRDISWATGVIPYYDGADMQPITSTAAGRSMLSAADAAAQIALLFDGTRDLTVPLDPYNATTWNNNQEVPSKDDVRDAIEAISGGATYIDSVDTNYFDVAGGELQFGSGKTVGTGRVVLESAGGTTWITNVVSSSVDTNSIDTTIDLLRATISPSDAPLSAGRVLKGETGVLLFNNSSGTINAFAQLFVNGTKVFDDQRSLSTSSSSVYSLLQNITIVRTSDTTADVRVSQSGSTASPASHETTYSFGDFQSGTSGMSYGALGVPCDWTSNVTFAIAIGFTNVSGTALEAKYIRPLGGHLFRP